MARSLAACSAQATSVLFLLVIHAVLVVAREGGDTEGAPRDGATKANWNAESAKVSRMRVRSSRLRQSPGRKVGEIAAEAFPSLLQTTVMTYTKKKGGCNASCQRRKRQAEQRRRQREKIDQLRWQKRKAIYEAKVQKEKMHRQAQGRRRDREIARAAKERAAATRVRRSLLTRAINLSRQVRKWVTEINKKNDRVSQRLRFGFKLQLGRLGDFEENFDQVSNRIYEGFKIDVELNNKLNDDIQGFSKAASKARQQLREWISGKFDDEYQKLNLMRKKVRTMKEIIQDMLRKQKKMKTDLLLSKKNIDLINEAYASYSVELNNAGEVSNNIAKGIDKLLSSQSQLRSEFELYATGGEEFRGDMRKVSKDIGKFEANVQAMKWRMDHEREERKLAMAVSWQRTQGKLNDLMNNIEDSGGASPLNAEAQKRLSKMVDELKEYLAKMHAKLESNKEKLGTGESEVSDKGMKEATESDSDSALAERVTKIVIKNLEESGHIPAK